jgi:hypothetical protein
MDNNARLQLQKMIKANDVEDQTELIRELKHSHKLRSDVNGLLLLKSKHGNNSDAIINDAMTECQFLFTYYTDIFNKVRKDEIDLNILFKFLDVLKQVEDGELDQHEGSFVVGKLLKELYVDSALKKAEKLEQSNPTAPAEPLIQPINISWKQFKTIDSKP